MFTLLDIVRGFWMYALTSARNIPKLKSIRGNITGASREREACTIMGISGTLSYRCGCCQA